MKINISNKFFFYFLAAIFFFIIFNRIFNHNIVTNYGIKTFVYSSLILVVCFANFFLFWKENNIKNILPLNFLVFFYFFLAYAMPFEFNSFTNFKYIWTIKLIEDCLFIFLLGITSYSCGFILISKFLKKRKEELICFKLSEKYFITSVFSMFVFVFYSDFNKNFFFPGHDQILITFKFVACCASFFLFNKKKNYLSIILLLLSSLVLFLDILSTSYAFPAVTIGTFFLISFYENKNISITFLLFLIIGFLLLHEQKGVLRTVYHQNEININNFKNSSSNLSFLENLQIKINRLEVLLKVIKMSSENNFTATTHLFENYQNTINRISHSFVSLGIVTYFTNNDPNSKSANFGQPIELSNKQIIQDKKIMINNSLKDKLNTLYNKGLIKQKNFITNQSDFKLVHYKYASLKNNFETNTKIRFLNGFSYKQLLYKFIPRVLWKNKPVDDMGNKFGVLYGVLHDHDFTTSWNMPILNESYINFGYKGVIFVMFILGLINRLIVNFYSTKFNYGFETIIGFYLCSRLFFMESHLSLVYGGVITVVIFLYIINIIFVILENSFNTNVKKIK